MSREPRRRVPRPRSRAIALARDRRRAGRRGAARGRARRRARSPMRAPRAAPLRAQRRVPAIVARGVPAALTVDDRGAPRARASRVRQPRPPRHRGRAAGGRRRARRPTRRPPPRAHRRCRPPPCASPGRSASRRWDHRAGEDAELLVYPDLPAARRLALAVRTGPLPRSGLPARGPLGLGTEFESIRDYLPDDDIRQVNWPATARIGRPMSNQYRIEQDRDVICLLDCGRLMAAPLSGGATRLDAAVDAATAVGLVADELGDRCGDGRVRRRGPAPARAAPARRRRARARGLRPAARAGRQRLRARVPHVASSKRALVIVFTDLLEEAAARSLVHACRSSRAATRSSSAGVVDPDLDATLANARRRASSTSTAPPPRSTSSPPASGPRPGCAVRARRCSRRPRRRSRARASGPTSARSRGHGCRPRQGNARVAGSSRDIVDDGRSSGRHPRGPREPRLRHGPSAPDDPRYVDTAEARGSAQTPERLADEVRSAPARRPLPPPMKKARRSSVTPGSGKMQPSCGGIATARRPGSLIPSSRSASTRCSTATTSSTRTC